jgi:signal transduction histidine kinase
MKIKVILIILFIITAYLVDFNVKKHMAEKRATIFKKHEQLIDNQYKVIVNILKNLSHSGFKGFIDKDHIKKVFKQRDRKKLYELLKNEYEYLKKFGFEQLHFHLPNNNSFLRMHYPQTFGDNLSDIRFSVDYVNKNKKYIEGIETGRVLPGYRFVYPLFFNKEYIGSVELSFRIYKIVDEFEKVYNIHTHYLIEKKEFKQKVFKELYKYYIPSSEHSEYVKLNRKYIDKFEPWVDDAKKREFLNKNLSTKKLFSLELDSNHDYIKDHEHLLVTFLPVKNIKGNSYSYFVFYSQSMELFNIEEDTKDIRIALFFLMILFFLLIYLSILYKNHIKDSNVKLVKFNKILEKKVKEKTNKLQILNNELEIINKDLESRVKKEVEKNREKDLQLFEQTKKASMGEMVGAIAHQWRQPLNELSIRVQKIKRDYEKGLIDENYLFKFVEKNKKTINFMSKTIDDFRNFFRIDKVKREFDVLKSIEEVLDLQATQLQHYNITLEINGKSFLLNGFKNEFQQVIMNIINNSKDAILENSISSPKILINIFDNKILIKDNGGGIKKDILGRIFDPYFTTKDEGKGTGMGLYVSKMIIEDNMGGKIYSEDTEDGTIFIIDFRKREEDEKN